jgi:hypothetical protein
MQNAVIFKIMVLWVVMPCSLLVDTDISEECAVPIFKFEVGRFGNVRAYVSKLHGGWA